MNGIRQAAGRVMDSRTMRAGVLREYDWSLRPPAVVEICRRGAFFAGRGWYPATVVPHAVTAAEGGMASNGSGDRQAMGSQAHR